MKANDVSFWACFVGAWFDMMCSFAVMGVLHIRNLAMLFLGAALAFAIGALCFWLNEKE
jgi:hypothetical protein